MITAAEKHLTEFALNTALEKGAQKARVCYNKNDEDLIATLNSQIDRITHCSDRSLTVSLFVDGRYGTFSTNKLEKASLADFITQSINITSSVNPDPYRDLPNPEITCKNALSGNELKLVDPFREEISPEMRIQYALDAAIFARSEYNRGKDWKIISEEGEYSDSQSDVLIMDSNGLCCLHSECCYDYGVEITIEHKGEKYSSIWWDSATTRKGLDCLSCGKKALELALGQIGSKAIKGGKYKLVLDSEVASKFVSPLLKALNAFSIQQNNSFLMDSLGKKLFPDNVNIVDLPHIQGNVCSKLFDSEGVATREVPIIEKGKVCMWFVNTYMSSKLGIAPTIESATRPCLLPWPQKGLNAEDIIRLCSEGIYVTSFNGGNCNKATGNFSYGIEGYYFKDGQIKKPISGMLVTGNFLDLWQKLIFAGDDARECMSKLIPTLAFSEVDFSG